MRFNSRLEIQQQAQMFGQTCCRFGLLFGIPVEMLDVGKVADLAGARWSGAIEGD
jgi:hypothetical protein